MIGRNRSPTAAQRIRGGGGGGGGSSPRAGGGVAGGPMSMPPIAEEDHDEHPRELGAEAVPSLTQRLPEHLVVRPPSSPSFPPLDSCAGSVTSEGSGEMIGMEASLSGHPESGRFDGISSRKEWRLVAGVVLGFVMFASLNSGGGRVVTKSSASPAVDRPFPSQPQTKDDKLRDLADLDFDESLSPKSVLNDRELGDEISPGGVKNWPAPAPRGNPADSSSPPTAEAITHSVPYMNGDDDFDYHGDADDTVSLGGLEWHPETVKRAEGDVAPQFRIPKLEADGSEFVKHSKFLHSILDDDEDANDGSKMPPLDVELGKKVNTGGGGAKPNAEMKPKTRSEPVPAPAPAHEPVVTVKTIHNDVDTVDAALMSAVAAAVPKVHNLDFIGDCWSLPCAVDEKEEYFQATSHEDMAIYEIFYTNPVKCCGVIVEIGAGDGLKRSASHFFEKGMGWKSVLFEANPDKHAELQVNRPDAVAINGAFCEPSVDKLMFDKGEFRAPFKGAVASERLAVTPPEPGFLERDVPCVKTAPIFEELGITHVDIMIVRIGGDPLSVVMDGFDWTLRVDVWVIVMDNDPPTEGSVISRDQVLRNVLRDNQYVKAEWDIRRWCGEEPGMCLPNEVYLRRGFNPLPVMTEDRRRRLMEGRPLDQSFLRHGRIRHWP